MRRTKEQLRAMFASMFKAKGLTATGKRKTTKKQIDLRVGAKRQNVTQKFLKHVGEHGRIAHPNRLVMGQKVYHLYTDYKTKTAGTGEDRWIIGKVTKFTSVGRSTPAVKVQWPAGVKLPGILTHDDFKRYSMMQVGGRYVKKPANYKPGSKRKLTEHLGETLPGEGDIPRENPHSYSTEEEHRRKMNQAAGHIVFGHADKLGNVLYERKKVLRQKRRAEYMRKYRAKKKGA